MRIVVQGSLSPHPSAFGCHLPHQGEGFGEKTANGGDPITPHTSLILAAERSSHKLTAQIKPAQTCRKTSARCKTSKTPVNLRARIYTKGTGDCAYCYTIHKKRSPSFCEGSPFYFYAVIVGQQTPRFCARWPFTTLFSSPRPRGSASAELRRRVWPILRHRCRAGS